VEEPRSGEEKPIGGDENGQKQIQDVEDEREIGGRVFEQEIGGSEREERRSESRKSESGCQEDGNERGEKSVREDKTTHGCSGGMEYTLNLGFSDDNHASSSLAYSKTRKADDGRRTTICRGKTDPKAIQSRGVEKEPGAKEEVLGKTGRRSRGNRDQVDFQRKGRKEGEKEKECQKRDEARKSLGQKDQGPGQVGTRKAAKDQGRRVRKEEEDGREENLVRIRRGKNGARREEEEETGETRERPPSGVGDPTETRPNQENLEGRDRIQEKDSRERGRERKKEQKRGKSGLSKMGGKVEKERV
jgi:hypothetical protein